MVSKRAALMDAMTPGRSEDELRPIRELYNKYSDIVSSRRVVKDFKWWCEAHGLRPHNYYRRGSGRNGYYAPPEFFEWWERVLLPQYRRRVENVAQVSNMRSSV